jgi:hypothetical protein
MKVTLRQRLKNNKIVLYLDYYNNGKRKVESLKLFLHPDPKTTEERVFNRKTMALAKTVWSQRQIEIQNGIYGFQDLEKLKGSFFNYLTTLSEKKNSSAGNFGNWDSMYKHLQTFQPDDISFQNINKQFVEDFKEYLDKKAKSKGGKLLSQNSKYSYFGKFKAALKQAVKDEFLKVNPSDTISHFKQGEPQREFLTLDELQSVVKVDCEIPLLKTAFIFSALTGLR